MTNNDIPKIRVGSRGSKLALIQVEEVRSLLEKAGRAVSFEGKIYSSRGDKDKTVSLTTRPADDFFTDTLDEAILANAIDVAVHSAKDLPQTLREGLEIFALTASPDETDAFVGQTTFDRLPEGARVATSSLLRQAQVKELNPKLRTVDIRGTIEERIQKMREGFCDGLIAATVALKRLGLEHLIQNIMPWEAAPLQGQLAVVGRAGDTARREIFSAIDARRHYGRVFLVGAGPGDPELITLKGIRALERADCVFYDYLVPEELLRHAPGAEKKYAGKRKGTQAMPQDDLNRLLRQKAMEGRTVVRLKGGDPLVFGRGADEIEYLRRRGIEVEVIPGISSAVGIPSRLGIPLTARGISSTVAFVSGYRQGEEEGRPEPLNIPAADTLVFLMGLTKLGRIIQSLEAAQWKKETPVMIISKGTCPQERILCGTLADIQRKADEEPPEPPVLIVVGETLKFYREHRGAPQRAVGLPRPRFEAEVRRRPRNKASKANGEPRLRSASPAKRAKRSGRERILCTGTNPEKFQALGEIVAFPTIRIVPARLDAAQVKTLLANLPGYDIILFTSRFAVEYFCELLKKEDYPIADLNLKAVAAIGRETARELVERRIHKTLVAKTETSQGLFAQMLAKFNLQGKKILFPRSSLPNPYLKQKLTAAGSRVDELAVYQNIKPPKRPLPKTRVDKILFTSPSTVRNFLEDYGPVPKEWRILSRGPLTSACLREMGYTNFEELK